MARVLAFTMEPGLLGELAAHAKRLGDAVALVPEGARVPAGVFARAYSTGAREPGAFAEALERLYTEHQPRLVVTVASKNNTTAAAILAAKHRLVMLTEALSPEIEGDTLRAKRRVLGGRAEASYTAPLPAVLSLARGSAEPLPLEPGQEPEPLEAPEPRVTLLESKEKVRESVNLETAEIVVGVGRGFRSKEDLRLAEELAQLLGGVVGASRPIVADYGWLSEDRWIGISGKKIKPKLYIAIGISGAPQHMAAAMDSKIIVAVNKDKNAPIFQYADYGVVADLYEFLPVLIKKLKERLGKG